MLVSISWVLTIHEKQINSTIIKNNKKKASGFTYI